MKSVRIFHYGLSLVAMTFCVCSILGFGCCAESPTPKMFMTKYCFWDYVIVNQSAILELVPTDKTKSFQCVATFVGAWDTSGPVAKDHLMLHFQLLNIDYNHFTMDKLRIYDGTRNGLRLNSDRELTPRKGLYGRYVKGQLEYVSGSIEDYVSRKQALTLFFLGSATAGFPGFKAILTTVRDPDQYGSCGDAAFRCKINPYCIPLDLRCNDVSNCGMGDNSDEQHCWALPVKPDQPDYKSRDLGLLAGCVMSILVLVIVITWLLLVCIKRARNRRRYIRECRNQMSSPPQPPDANRLYFPPYLRRWRCQPPPIYSEQANGGVDVTSPLEQPPPYSEYDRAGQLNNSFQQAEPPVNLATSRSAQPRQPQAGLDGTDPTDSALQENKDNERAAHLVVFEAVELPSVRAAPLADTAASTEMSTARNSNPPESEA